MKSTLRKALFLSGAFCWLLFAVGFGVLLVVYVSKGAGVQFFGWSFSSGSVLIGLVHVSGLMFASGLCFVVAAGLWVRSFGGRAKQ
jgi:hypothetical protein